MSKIIPITVAKPVTEKVSDAGNSKDWAMVRTMASLARPAPQKNVTRLEINSVTRHTKLALLLLPEWGTFFPPYNMARLVAVARAAGYQVSAHDVNIECYNAIKGQLDFDPWDPAKEFLWERADTYFEQIHPHCEPVYNQVIERLVTEQPDVIGFTLYYTNEAGTKWMVERLRERLPNAKIIVGGPQAIDSSPGTEEYFDYVVKGEGERLLLEILNSVENKTPIEERVLIQPKTERLDLDSLPFPDYSDYDLNKYTMPNGASSEISRGCVAKCVFCTEVHFWKYRGRQAGSILDEVEYQHKTYGVDFIWFIDSLVNGNLKELRAFSLGIVERKLKLRWQGYARCDERMDLDYYKDLAAGGCHMLNYGIESGSQRVLNDMKKSVSREAMEQNLRDAASVGIAASSNWIVGFPTEKTQDLADTLTLAYRIRNYNNSNISPGITMMLSPGAEVTDNLNDYNIARVSYMEAWTTKDMLNTKLHRMIRQKNFLILLHNLNAHNVIYGFDRPRLRELYNIKLSRRGLDTIPYEEFDYSIIDTGLGKFADSVVNEIWPLFRTLWRAYGSLKITVTNDPEIDLIEWGHRLACNYTGTQTFEIDEQGSWTADFTYKFVQDSSLEKDHFKWPNRSFEYHYAGQGNW